MNEITVCEPPPGTEQRTWHILSCPLPGTRMPAYWNSKLWFPTIENNSVVSPRSANQLGWRYVGPLDLDAAPMTTGVTAVLNKASAWRDAAYALADGNHSIGIGDLSRELLDAIDIVRPYTPPDPVAAALAKLRATTGDEDKYTAAAARAYLDALDAKEAL